MISGFKLKAGKNPGDEGEVINCTPLTVFVGPNNSGKSLLLSELRNFCVNPNRGPHLNILDDVYFEGVGEENLDRFIGNIQLKPIKGEVIQEGMLMVGNQHSVHHVNRQVLREVMLNPNSNLAAFGQWFLAHSSLLLDGQSRMNLVNPLSSGDLQVRPTNSLQKLFVDDEKRAEIRRMVYEAFGFYYVIDPTGMQVLRIKFSERPPRDVREERGIDQEAVKFHSEAIGVEACSDGVKAFTGILTEIMAGDPSLIFMDEPEAFLHPSLAYKLGVEMSSAATVNKKKIFVSTHSSSFIMGCIQSGVPVNIVRLTYQKKVATARTLSSEEVLAMMRNPLLRSVGVIDSLFYESVVVTESDSDRSFYQEVNYRLLSVGDERGIPNCLFINAQNKQTISTILAPLRKLGVSAAGIVDVDALKEGGKVWSSMLAAVNYPPLSRDACSQIRKKIKDAIDATGRDMKRDGGVNILTGAEKEAALNLLEELGSYGYFIIASGEVESWLKELKVGGHGTEWLIKMFEKMGGDVKCPSYVSPDVGDVWDFIGVIKKWLADPRRKGIRLY